MKELQTEKEARKKLYEYLAESHTDDKTYNDLFDIYVGLIAAGQPRDMMIERYLKLHRLEVLEAEGYLE